MECNKEEAIRAKDIAEKKMQNKDFVGAKKIVLKAQQLFPELDNISQMLTVCEVHCSAGIIANGEMDWYGILQVEQTADESSIKKQYRKLALLLHPDKNKFAGAEAAFKLIGEAHMTLSDRDKRSLYDMKRRANIVTVSSKQPSQQPSRTSFARKQPGVSNNFASTTTFHFSSINQQQQQQPTSVSQAFWTICPSCGMRYQYLRTILNRSLRCQRCLKPFYAYEFNAQAVPPPGTNSSHPWNHTQIPKQEVPCQQSHFGNSSSSTGFQGNVAGGPTAQEPLSSSGINTAHSGGGSTSKEKKDGVVGEEGGAGDKVQFEKVNPEEVNKRKQPVKPSAVNAKRKRGRKLVVESSDSDSSTDSEGIVIEEGGRPAEQNAGTSSTRYPRRSTRQKQNVTYNEDGSEDDDDFVSPPKRLRKGGSLCNTDHRKTFSEDADGVPNNTDDKGVPHEESLPNGKEPVNKYKMHESEQAGDEREENFKAGTLPKADSTVDSSTMASQNLGSFSYPDPEFCDFEKERDPSKFEVDQIWAVYDNLDAMPRYYARIREVYAPDFRLRLTWLEHNAASEVEMAWTEEELPVACGNYRLGKSDFTKDRQMFSHLMCWKKGTKRNTYDIYPRKGEIWALFKGWDVGWSSDAENHRLYEYEIVEVLSDFADGSDISVVHLVKIKGFLSLFMRAIVKGTARIPSAEVLRFSHRVPSYRLTGAEREGIPEGSFELDIASLPSDFGETFPSISLESAAVKSGKLGGKCSDPCFRSGEEKLATCSVNKKNIELNDENVWEMENTGSRGLSPKKVNLVVQNSSADADAEHPSSPPSASSSPTTYEYPQTEFHDFQEDRSIEKLQRGQIWALYSDVDKYPKYYAKIKSVEDSTVKVSWVELCSRQEDEVLWSEKGLPSACGRFKVERKMITFDTIDTFSHLVHAKPSGRRDQYDIYPRSGEVWAIYKNWSVEWTRSDLDKCEYDVVEVLEHSGSVVRVLLLNKVDDYNAVFMPATRGIEHTIEIPIDESLRFSHQIPAFRLTNEVGGVLQGYWELDSASVPDKFI